MTLKHFTETVHAICIYNVGATSESSSDETYHQIRYVNVRLYSSITVSTCEGEHLDDSHVST